MVYRFFLHWLILRLFPFLGFQDNVFSEVLLLTLPSHAQCGDEQPLAKTLNLHLETAQILPGALQLLHVLLHCSHFRLVVLITKNLKVCQGDFSASGHF